MLTEPVLQLQLKQIFDAIPDAVIYTQPVFGSAKDGSGSIVDFEVVFSNQKANEYGGYPDTGLIGKKLLADKVAGTQTGEVIYKQNLDVYLSGKTLEFAYNNQMYGLVMNVRRSRFDGGVLSVSRETTGQLAAEEANRRQAAFFNEVLDTSPTSIVSYKAMHDSAGVVYDFKPQMLNRQALAVTGLTLSEVQASTLCTLYPLMRTNGVLQRFAEVLKQGETFQGEMYIEPFGGWFNVTIAPQENGQLVAVYLDINEIKQAQMEVEMSAAYLQAVIDTAQTGIFLFMPVYDEQGNHTDFRFRLANRALASYVGQSSEAINGSLGSRWFPSYKTNGLFDKYKDTYDTGKTNRFEFHYKDDGINAWLDIMSTKLGNEVLVTFTDYSAMKQLQLQLESSISDLKRSNSNLEQFAYVASHDLQEPLRKIQAFGDILQTRFKEGLGDDGIGLIGRMQKASDRMRLLIDDLLSYSRASAKRAAMAPVSLNAVIREILGDLETTIRDKDATINTGAMLPLVGDASQLRQLFQNLLSNAIKFAREDAKPVINIESKVVLGRDVIQDMPALNARKAFQLVEITDNGIGFEPQYAERIFQIFQRLHGRGEYPGTGVGLSIVQKVVENHSGYITAEGRPGEGATFRILFPIPSEK